MSDALAVFVCEGVTSRGEKEPRLDTRILKEPATETVNVRDDWGDITRAVTVADGRGEADSERDATLEGDSKDADALEE